MTITFEEEKSFNQVFIAILLVLALLIAGAFFAWKILFIDTIAVPPAADNEPKLKTELLNDTRIKNMEIFPQIPAATVEGGRVNPFTENTAELQNKETVAKAGAIQVSDQSATQK